MSYSQFVVFSLGNEEYGIEISYAQEIIRIPQQTTKIPNMPVYIEGMINLRGNVIPVVDLKKRFGFMQSERSIDSRLLILNLENMLLGIIVDDVSEVMNIDENSIEKLGFEISSISGNSIQGIGKIDGRLILMLNVQILKSEIFKNKLEMEGIV
jgi:purine-binding chemotaxis protein CheW